MSKAVKMKQPTQASLDEAPEIDLKKARILGRDLRKDRKLPLRTLREAAGKTQEAIASASGMDQSEISRVEQRDDMRLSTLRRYAKVERALRTVLRDLVDGVRAIHRAGRLHRDLKPSNVLVADGRAVILDFGLAQSVASADRSTELGAAGTPAYMAPEPMDAGGAVPASECSSGALPSSPRSELPTNSPARGLRSSSA